VSDLHCHTNTQAHQHGLSRHTGYHGRESETAVAIDPKRSIHYLLGRPLRRRK
jgi:hypothetical protein